MGASNKDTAVVTVQQIHYFPTSHGIRTVLPTAVFQHLSPDLPLCLLLYLSLHVADEEPPHRASNKTFIHLRSLSDFMALRLKKKKSNLNLQVILLYCGWMEEIITGNCNRLPLKCRFDMNTDQFHNSKLSDDAPTFQLSLRKLLFRVIIV